MAKYFMTTVSFFFHAPFMNEVSPFTAKAVNRKSNTQDRKRSREGKDERNP